MQAVYQEVACTVCGKSFIPRFTYQAKRTKNGDYDFFCSQNCYISKITSNDKKKCHNCGKNFELKYAWQIAQTQGDLKFFCSDACRNPGKIAAHRKRYNGVRKIAVLNQKGGTGKTTTAVSLAAALATRGFNVLLVDMDAQGNVGVSLGISGEFSAYHLLITEMQPDDIAIPVRPNLDVIPSNDTLASAEIKLVNMPNREAVLRRKLGAASGYEFIILDCGPSLSMLNQNALMFADEVLIPVSCDYLALVGVKQVLKTIQQINTIMHHPVKILGVLPTFFDRRLRISTEVVRNLKDFFKDLLLPPIRSNTRLKEAPSVRKTIFEFAPNSHGAEDYLHLVDAILAKSGKTVARSQKRSQS